MDSLSCDRSCLFVRVITDTPSGNKGVWNTWQFFNIPQQRTQITQSPQLSPSEPLWIGNYKQQPDPEMSVHLHDMRDSWFMAFCLVVGRWARGNERALRRARPPSLILQNWAMEKTHSHSIRRKKTSRSVTPFWTHLRNTQIAWKQLYNSSMSLYGPLRTNEKAKPFKKRKKTWEMDSRWRIYQIQLGFSIFFCAGRVKEEVMNIWTRVNGSTTENVWLGTELL